MNNPTGTPQPAAPSMVGDFYVTGGTLRPDAPSYVERRADKDLWESLLRGEFCYVLTSRQMGKSSLMVRTVKRLRADGVAVAVLDLTAIGQNLSIDQWYDGLISRLGQQFDLEDELLDFWALHPELGPLQRWLTALEKIVLERISNRVVIFVDEIDIVRSLAFSTDEFFAAIRECHNRRTQDPKFGRLAFGLLGVATPTDLIRDTRMTPFNIGRRIELNDFSAEEAAPLARGLGADEKSTGELLARVLSWTGGHPYLTQRLCRTLAESVAGSSEPSAVRGVTPPPILPTIKSVDRLAEKLFLSRQARERDDNLIFVRERILRSEGDVAGLLLLYRKIRSGVTVLDDETNPLISILRLAGITRSVGGRLQVRNRIYSEVFDLTWIQTNMPAAEVRRQRKARHRGVITGLAIAGVLILLRLVVWPLISDYREKRTARITFQQMQDAYRKFNSYQDLFETTVDIGSGGSVVPVRGSGSIAFHRPDLMSVSLRTEFTSPELEVKLVADGPRSVFLAPALKQFKVLRGPRGPSGHPQWPPPTALLEEPGAPPPEPPGPGERRTMFEFPASLALQLGPMRALPLYRWFLDPRALDRFWEDVRNVHYSENSELDGRSVRVLTWQQASDGFLKSMGLINPMTDSENPPIPVTVWVDNSDHLIRQIRLDLTAWAKQLMGENPDVLATSLVLTETHKQVVTDKLTIQSENFRFRPMRDWQPVDSFSPPATGEGSTLKSLQRMFSKMIPPRLRLATPEMIDLSDYYNAPLTQTWHPGTPNNSLDALPMGLLQFGDVVFDVRGLVQLSSKSLRNAGGRYPEKVAGIRIGLACRRLHFLQASGWKSRDGTHIGSYIVHYIDGSEATIPIVYGEDVRDWNVSSDAAVTLKRSTIVWKVTNDAGYHVRLFKTTWSNPYPEKQVVSLDYVSAMADAAPFVVAITAEP